MKLTPKEAREKAGLSQMEVFRRTGIARSTLNRWEAGRGALNIKTLKILCNLYGISLGDIEI